MAADFEGGIESVAGNFQLSGSGPSRPFVRSLNSDGMATGSNREDHARNECMKTPLRSHLHCIAPTGTLKGKSAPVCSNLEGSPSNM